MIMATEQTLTSCVSEWGRHRTLVLVYQQLFSHLESLPKYEHVTQNEK